LDACFVCFFGFEARELLISLESFISAMCELEGTSLAGIVFLGRGYVVVRSQGLRKNLSLITRGLRLILCLVMVRIRRTSYEQGQDGRSEMDQKEG